MFSGGLKKTLLVFGILHLGIFLCFTVVARMYYPATGEFERSLALRILDGQVPYRDFVLEYPPLAVFAFLVPALLLRTAEAYSFAFAGEMLIFDLIILFLITLMARRSGMSGSGPLIVYTVCLVAVGPLAVCRYDLLPAMLTLSSLWAFTGRKTAVAWSCAAVGITAKVYPVLLVPLFLIYDLLRGEYRRSASGLAIFLGVLLAFVVPWLAIDAGGFIRSMTYHLERGLHSESSYGTALLLAQLFGWTSVEGSLTFGSWNLISPLAEAAGKLSLYVTVGLLAIVYAMFGWLTKKMVNKGPGEGVPEWKYADRLVFQFAFLAVIVFMLTNKVFSAQYLMWLCPLLPLLDGWGRKMIWALFVLAAAATQYVFPYKYIEFELGHPVPVILLAVRNLILLAVAGAACYGTIRSRGSLPGQAG